MELYRVEEGKNYFYLMPSAGTVYTTEENNEELNIFLRKFVKYPLHSSVRLRKTSFVFMLSGLLLFTVYAVIYSFMPADNQPRVWVEYLFLISFLLLMMAVVLSEITVLRNRQRNHMYKLIYTIVCIVVFILLGAYAIITHAEYGDVIKNTNGTYTVKQYSETIWRLYEGNGLFYLQYLRPMSGPEDNDPKISISEWWDKRYPEETEEPSQDSDETEKTNSSDKISDGYTKIIAEYYTDCANNAHEEYSAKGDSYYVIKEDDKTITLLVYDRDSRNGKCGLYVLETVEKESDGSYSISDAEINDIYAYEYSGGKIVSSGMHEWSDTTSKEYLEMTGE